MHHKVHVKIRFGSRDTNLIAIDQENVVHIYCKYQETHKCSITYHDLIILIEGKGIRQEKAT